MREYLKDLEPEEVIDRLNNGERVYYKDSKGNEYSYKVYKGMTIRYNKDGEVDGYNRSIYSTGEAYFETEDEWISLSPNRRYKTRDGRVAITTIKDGSWIKGFILEKSSDVRAASWKMDGLFYGEGTRDPRDIVEELD